MSLLQLISQLRAMTDAPMSDCKQALSESNNNLENAQDWLRKKGVLKAGKKAGRIAADGLAAVKNTGKQGFVVEVNSETDFAAKSDRFLNLTSEILENFASHGGDFNISHSAVQPIVTNAIATIGENISFRRAAALSVTNGAVVHYIHNAIEGKSGIGKIAVLVALESDSTDTAALNEIGKKVAMHITASSPVSLDIASIPQDLLNRERDIATEQTKASGKPENMIAKIVEGKIAKFASEVALLEQLFVMDNTITVGQFIKNFGHNTKITNFVCFRVGENIEKPAENFAEEVAKMVSNIG